MYLKLSFLIKICYNKIHNTICPSGGMVDARDLKSLEDYLVWVRVPPRAQNIIFIFSIFCNRILKK